MRTAGKDFMIEVDGSLHSGSGTILRYAVALAALLGEPLHMIRIRAKREKPGLRPQHLQAVRACCSLSGGELEGAAVGSTEIFFKPGKSLKDGDFQWDIGTAGSTTMLAFTLIPLALYAGGPCRFSMIGGLFQDFAPSAFHLQRVLLPLLRRMGAEIRLEILRPGYPPKGEGELRVEIKPLGGNLKPLQMMEQGKVREIRGISLASHLEGEKVSGRMADQCEKLLEKRGYQIQMESDQRSDRSPKRSRFITLGAYRHRLSAGFRSGRETRQEVGSDRSIRGPLSSRRPPHPGYDGPAFGRPIDPFWSPCRGHDRIPNPPDD